MSQSKKHVFLVGAKSIGAYGGYETFVDKLLEYHEQDESLQYHVACKANGDGCMDETKLNGAVPNGTNRFRYRNADCFKIPLPNIGAAQAILYDLRALKESVRVIEHEKIQDAVVYIMTCRVGPWSGYYYRKIHKLGGKVYLNPDGHEWMRAKWNAAIRKYWKISERQMVKNSDLVVCDSVNIEKYIHKSYDHRGRHGSSPETVYLAYGAETRKSILSDDDERLLNWYREKNLKKKEYYLIVGRFVPENNYETMIREFMKSDSKKDLAIITNVNDNFLQQLEERLHFRKDPRIKFVGTVYDKELLMKIRENAFAYFHGHEVGGTNPSLLEALGSTDLSMLLDVGFNREVAEDSALYWTKQSGDLAKLIHKADHMTEEEIIDYGRRSTKRIEDAFSWKGISDQYKKIFVMK